MRNILHFRSKVNQEWIMAIVERYTRDIGMFPGFSRFAFLPQFQSAFCSWLTSYARTNAQGKKLEIRVSFRQSCLFFSPRKRAPNRRKLIQETTIFPSIYAHFLPCLLWWNFKVSWQFTSHKSELKFYIESMYFLPFGMVRPSGQIAFSF